MADWTDDDDLTEPTETDDRPLMGVTGGQRARAGDSYTLAFTSDGEKTQTAQGERVQFDARLLDATFSPDDGDGSTIAEGDDVVLMTGSSRFLSSLKPFAPVGGDVLRVTVEGTGYDAEYRVEEAEADE